MKIVISPAKSLDLKSEIPTNDFTIPVFIDKTEILNAKIAAKRIFIKLLFKLQI